MNEILEKIAEVVNSCLGPLNGLKVTGSDIRDLLIQLCATILLFVVIRVFLWKPITNILETRRQAVDKALEDAKVSKDTAKALEEELSSELAKAKASVQEILAKAEKDGNLRREQIITEAKQEAKQRLENLELELEQEKNSMQKEIRKEIVDIAFAAAEKIVAKEIDQNKYMDVVDEILKGAN
ncbi:MAG: F0F1 ATP synthase subunit B [Anaeroplasmataceae bacterium]|jgi:ATP synthase, F0 subunit b|nr:F0F1 ATP synthase subunit B [Anaeroplasmataceae bacterium]